MSDRDVLSWSRDVLQRLRDDPIFAARIRAAVDQLAASLVDIDVDALGADELAAWTALTQKVLGLAAFITIADDDETARILRRLGERLTSRKDN